MPKHTRLTRDEVPFSWSASGGIPAMATLAGVRFDRVFRELDAIVEAYTKGKPMVEEMFGPDVRFGGPRWAGVSYGHVNCLGCPLVFPEGSEVAHEPIYDTLEQGVRELKKDVDFTKAGLFPFYLDLWEKLKRAFPGEDIQFSGFGFEGPVTTAWCLRGHDFFTDIHDQPELVKQYLGLVTASIVKYRAVVRAVNNEPPFPAAAASVCDDVAAMIAPDLWPELVVPFLEAYFSEQTDGGRSAHIEDMKPEHLKYVDELALDGYDPSVSPSLTPALVRDGCSAPFGWRLNEGEYAHMTSDEVRAFVFNAAADGASSVRTGVWRNNCAPETAAKVRVFIRAAEDVKDRLAEGLLREELRGLAAG